ncbi:MAG TPA: ATP-binding cassette domain-containing protein [Planctomycetota bacterium]|nr:ATP-binding cassette domain-containing protein [Planctomycetota bacterium]
MTTSAAPANGPAIACHAVSKQIGDKLLLDGIDLSLVPGEQVAVIGPSGAGKTTLLRLCAGVIWPTRGRVVVMGHTTGALGARGLCRLRRQVGFLYQQDNLVPGLRVAHNVLMGKLGKWSLLRSLWSLFVPQQVGDAHAALQRVELGDKLWAMPGELSGGEQQRVAVARLLVQDPRVLLCDEPVSSLDIRLGREIVKLITSISRERGTTLLVSLHTLELLREGFDRVVALRGGRMVWQGRPEQITRELLKDVYGTEYQALHLDEVALAPRAPDHG